jgi:hypothetical protein
LRPAMTKRTPGRSGSTLGGEPADGVDIGRIVHLAGEQDDPPLPPSLRSTERNRPVHRRRRDRCRWRVRGCWQVRSAPGTGSPPLADEGGDVGAGAVARSKANSRRASRRWTQRIGPLLPRHIGRTWPNRRRPGP